VIHVALGNCSASDVATVLLNNSGQVKDFLKHKNKAYLVLPQLSFSWTVIPLLPALMLGKFFGKRSRARGVFDRHSYGILLPVEIMTPKEESTSEGFVADDLVSLISLKWWSRRDHLRGIVKIQGLGRISKNWMLVVSVWSRSIRIELDWPSIPSPVNTSILEKERCWMRQNVI